MIITITNVGPPDGLFVTNVSFFLTRLKYFSSFCLTLLLHSSISFSAVLFASVAMAIVTIVFQPWVVAHGLRSRSQKSCLMLLLLCYRLLSWRPSLAKRHDTLSLSPPVDGRTRRRTLLSALNGRGSETEARFLFLCSLSSQFSSAAVL